MNRSFIGYHVPLVLFVTLLMPCWLFSQQNDTTYLQQGRRYINEINQDYERALKQGDFQAIALPYGSEGVFVTIDGKSIIGKDAIQQYYQERAMALAKVSSLDFQQQGLVPVGPYLYEWGWIQFHFSKNSGLASRSGHYMTVWRKDAEGRWKILRNLSLP
jgi:uncharacterized protein (TIGR02246 family)